MTTPSGILVRQVRWEDFDDVREVYYRLYDERAAGEPIGITLFVDRPTYGDEVTWFGSHLRRTLEGHEIFLVAEVGGRVVGSCTIAPSGPPVPSEESHIGDLGIVVHHDHRGKGVGTALLGGAIEQARSKFELLYLTVFSMNERAQRLYRHFGFIECGHLPRVIKRGDQYYDEELMVLDLAPPGAGTGANR